MIRYSGIFLSLLMLSGCATDALKNEQAETVITAGNKAVAANASFFKQYYASRENFLVNFYATNPEDVYKRQAQPYHSFRWLPDARSIGAPCSRDARRHPGDHRP